jgi:hypothetical protein
LLDGSHTKQGFLFLRQGDELALATSIADHELPAAIEARARDFLDATSSDEETTTASGLESSAVSSMWTVSGGRVYHPVVLTLEDEGKHLSVGVAVLLENREGTFRYPFVAARALAGLMRSDAAGEGDGETPPG